MITVSVLTGCTGRGGSNEAVQAQDTIYTRQAAMSIYAYQPVRALQIIDSAVTVGNLSQWQADVCKARIYSMSLMKEQLDSLIGGPEDIRLDTAQAIGERLLSHDSVRANLKRQQDVLEILAYTDRMQNDTTGWMRRSRELVGVCRQIGPMAENDALRTEAEIGAALCAMNQYEEGMAKLDSAIVLLSEKGTTLNDLCNSFTISKRFDSTSEYNFGPFLT